MVTWTDVEVWIQVLTFAPEGGPVACKCAWIELEPDGWLDYVGHPRYAIGAMTVRVGRRKAP